MSDTSELRTKIGKVVGYTERDGKFYDYYDDDTSTHEVDVTKKVEQLEALIESQVRAELKSLKQGHKPPYKAANAEILVNAITDRLATLNNDKEALLGKLPKKRELAPNGHSERVGFNEAINQATKAIKDVYGE